MNVFNIIQQLKCNVSQLCNHLSNIYEVLIAKANASKMLCLAAVNVLAVHYRHNFKQQCVGSPLSHGLGREIWSK